MLTSHLLGAILALVSAVIWGSGDFSGGLATRRSSPYQVLALASLTGVVILAIFLFLRGEGWPSLDDLAWSAAAGVAGAFGIAALYRGLAVGNAALIAPTAAVIGVIVPILVGALVEGFPGLSRLGGFASGIVGIALWNHLQQVYLYYGSLHR